MNEQDARHLWPNLVTQLVLGAAATARRPGVPGQLCVLFVYLLAGFGGGVAFIAVEGGRS